MRIFERVLFHFHFEQALETNRYSVQELVIGSLNKKHKCDKSRVGSSHPPTRTGGPGGRQMRDGLTKPRSPFPNAPNCDCTLSVSVLVSLQSLYLTTRPSVSIFRDFSRSIRVRARMRKFERVLFHFHFEQALETNRHKLEGCSTLAADARRADEAEAEAAPSECLELQLHALDKVGWI